MGWIIASQVVGNSIAEEVILAELPFFFRYNLGDMAKDILERLRYAEIESFA